MIPNERARTVLILEAAVRILGRDGPNKFSASTLAKDAGVSKATLFHHFRTWDEIPIVAIEDFWVQSLASKAADRTSARTYLLQLGALRLSPPQQRATLLKAHVVFLVKAVFDPPAAEAPCRGCRADARPDAGGARKARSPAGAARRELDIVARIAFDGLMMAVVTAENLARRAWTRLVDLLVKDLKP